MSIRFEITDVKLLFTLVRNYGHGFYRTWFAAMASWRHHIAHYSHPNSPLLYPAKDKPSQSADSGHILGRRRIAALDRALEFQARPRGIMVRFLFNRFRVRYQFVIFDYRFKPARVVAAPQMK